VNEPVNIILDIPDNGDFIDEILHHSVLDIVQSFDVEVLKEIDDFVL